MGRFSSAKIKAHIERVSPSTRTLLLLILTPMPLFYAVVHFFFTLRQYETLESEMLRIFKKSHHLDLLHQKEQTLLSTLKNPDHFYIDNHLEPLTFLEPEIKKTETVLFENPNEEKLKKRLRFLKEGTNRLRFIETHTRTHGTFLEVEEDQQNPVEIDEEDLKKILSLVEGVTIWPYGPKEKRPQLIIRDFELSKKENSSQDYVFVINMNLIKRESNNEKN